jgi:methylenetetrahydrofolate reductase (NADPH)
MTAPAAASRLEHALTNGRFAVTAEIVPPRSADPDAVTEQATGLAGLVDAANVTDNPTSRVHMSAVAGAALVARAGIEPVLQMTCRDRNRMALSSDLLGAWALGSRNLLCLSGDPPGVGDHPDAKVVFDLGVLDLVRLADGLRARGELYPGEVIDEPPRYLIGVADAPLIPNYDYARLEAKAEAGARFVQTQIVFDVDAFAAWADGARERGILDRLHILAGIAVVRSARSARFLGTLPGVIVPDALMRRLESAGEQGVDEGVAVAAELVRGVRSIPGIRGVHLMALGHPEVIRAVALTAGLADRSAPA